MINELRWRYTTLGAFLAIFGLGIVIPISTPAIWAASRRVPHTWPLIRNP